MRFFKTIPLTALLISAPAFTEGALETLNLDHTMRVDSIGDGLWTIKFGLTAPQFQNWQRKYGQNNALLIRDLNRYVSQYHTSDWNVQVNQMERTIVISLKFSGGALHKGGGLFEFRVPKQWRGGDRAGTTFSYNFVEAIAGGGVAQNNVKLILPDSAARFTEDKAETGDRIIQYTVPVAGSGKLALWLGLIALLAGGVIAAAAFRMPETAPAAAKRNRENQMTLPTGKHLLRLRR